MSVTCFDNLLYFESCANPAAGRLDVKSIGLTPQFLSQLLTEEYQDEAELFETKKQLAISHLTNDVAAKYSEKYKVRSLIDGMTVGVYANATVSPEAKYKGILHELTTGNVYLDLYIETISLFITETKSVEVKVFDLLQGKVIDTITVSCTAGEITTVDVNKLYKSNGRKLQLFFAHDTSSTTTYKSEVGDCQTCPSSYRRSNSFENIYSATLGLMDGITKTNIRYIGEAGGLSIKHSLQCNHTDWICSYANRLTLALAYKTYSLCCEYGLHESPNHRLNTTEGVNAELLLQRQQVAEMKYRELLDQNIQGITVPNDALCFECKRSTFTKTVAP